jgi:signal transduction histidine kinase
VKRAQRTSDLRGFTGSWLTLLLLLGGLGVSTFLALQAFQAERSHRRTVDQALENIATVVGERSSVWLIGDFISGAQYAFRTLDDVDGAPRETPLPGPEVIQRERFRGSNCRCPLTSGEGTSFRLDLASGELTTLPADVGDFVPSGLHAGIFDALGDSLVRQFTERWEISWYPRLVVLEEEDRLLVAPLRVLKDDNGSERAAYGLILPGEGFLEGSLRWLYEQEQTWEPFLGSDLWSLGDVGVIEAATLETPGARTFSRFGGEPTGLATARFRLRLPLHGLNLRVALHPSLVAQLPLGGTPANRTPFYALLLLLNGGLVGAAFLQLRREQEFIRRRTEFLAGFSHEARSPLATIRLYAQGLRFDRIRDPAERTRALDVMDRESRRLVHMVSNFLSHRAREGEALALSPRRVELGRALSAFAESVDSELRERSANLSLEGNGPVWIHADPIALQQILRNLLENALKYGPVGQTIRLGFEPANGTAAIAMEDEGPGIPEHERAMVFEPFVRTPGGIRSGAGGAGLGLSVVRDLVSLQGGGVRVEDGHRGRGARLVVELPLASDVPWEGDGRPAWGPIQARRPPQTAADEGH